MSSLPRSIRRLSSDANGGAMVEFAIIAPVMLAMLVGIAQSGVYFMARAGLKNAVEDASRYATIYPKPSQSAIQSRISTHKFGLRSNNIIGPTVTFDTSSSPNFVTISMGYTFTINYILGTKTLTLTETRRAYTVS